MNVIERIFGISPDGGSGATEVVYLATFLLAAALLAWRRMAGKQGVKTSDR